MVIHGSNGYPWFQGIISLLRSGSVCDPENPIHVESESSIDKDNIFAISLPRVQIEIYVI